MLVKVQFRKEISLQVSISRKIYTENEFLWNYKMCGMIRLWVFRRDCSIIENWFIHQLLLPVRHYWSHAWVKNLLPLCCHCCLGFWVPMKLQCRDWEMRAISQCCCGCHHHHFSPRKPQSEQWTLLQRNMIFTTMFISRDGLKGTEKWPLPHFSLSHIQMHQNFCKTLKVEHTFVGITDFNILVYRSFSYIVKFCSVF